MCSVCISGGDIVCCSMQTSLLSLLARGLQMSSVELSSVVPLLSVFSALFSHVLTLMHDVEFFDPRPTGQYRSPLDVCHGFYM